MKGWVFINHSEAQTQRSPFCNTPSGGTPSAKPVPTPAGPSEDAVHVAWIETPQYIKGLPNCLLEKGLLSSHPRKSSPPILSLGTSASHTHPGLSF